MNRFLPVSVAVFGILIFIRTIQIRLFGDNLQLLFSNPSCNPLTYFIKVVPNSLSYRPFQAAFMALSQIIAGPFNTFPINIARIILHCMTGFTVYFGMRKFGFSILQSTIAMVVMIISQCSVMGVCDNFSMIFSTLSGLLSLLFLISGLIADKNTQRSLPMRIAYSVISGILCFCAVWSRESGIMFTVTAVFLVVRSTDGQKNPFLIKRIATAAPYMLLALFYLIFRSSLDVRQPSFGSGIYQFTIGMNILKNSLMLFASLICCWSSVDCFRWYHTGNWAPLLIVGIVSLLFFSMIVLSLLKRKKMKLCLMMAVFGILSCTPVVPLNHISELYSYSILPFYSVLAGVGFGSLIERHDKSQRIKVLLSGIFILWMSVQAVASVQKSNMILNNSLRADLQISSLKNVVTECGRGATVFIYTSDPSEYTYSLFRMSENQLLRFGIENLLEYWGREDVRVYRVPISFRAQLENATNAVHIKCENDTYVRYPCDSATDVNKNR